MTKSVYQKIDLKLSDIIELIIGIEKEEILYLRAGSEKKVITFKLLYESIQSDYKALKDNKNVVAITKKSKNTFILRRTGKNIKYCGSKRKRKYC